MNRIKFLILIRLGDNLRIELKQTGLFELLYFLLYHL